jgi:hypothetical protein
MIGDPGVGGLFYVGNLCGDLLGVDIYSHAVLLSLFGGKRDNESSKQAEDPGRYGKVHLPCVTLRSFDHAPLCSYLPFQRFDACSVVSDLLTVVV